VLASRNLRHEREVRDAAQRQLAAQREREAATHRALVRARMVASVCAVLMLLAIAGAAFGWIAMHHARSAEAEAQKSRSDAEKLVSFLIEDFYAELEPTGRLETLGKLAHMTVGYYDSLPPELVTRQTQINRAMALVREGVAQNSSGKVDAAFKSFGEAQTTFEKLHASGDTSEAVTYGLALVLYSEGFNAIVGMTGRGTVADVGRASDLLRPLVAQSGASRRVRQLYADTLNIFSLTQPMEKAVATCDEARKVLVTLGAMDLSDLNAASSYADTGDSEARHLLSLGRVAKAQKLEQEVYDLTEKILARRPGDLHALSDRTFAAQLLGELANRQHDPAAAADYAIKAAKAGEDEVRFNPSDLGAWQRWTLALSTGAEFKFERGEIAEAIATMRSLLALEQDKRRPSSLGPVIWYHWLNLAVWQAQTGDSIAAAASLKSFLRDVSQLLAQLAPGDLRRQILAKADLARDGLELSEGETQAALADATTALNHLDSIKIPADDKSSTFIRDNILAGNLATAARAAVHLGKYAQAEALARRWLAVPANATSDADPKIRTSVAQSVLAHAVAMQGRQDEAQKILQPALAYDQQQQQEGAQDTTFRLDYAYALYVSAISRPADSKGQAERKMDLDAASKLINGASPEAQRLADMREVAHLIAIANESRSD
jgi:tetratricopeptide (TPR) repeat protein